MNESVAALAQLAANRAGDILGGLRPDLIDGAEGSALIGGVYYTVKARTVPPGQVGPQALPEEIRPQAQNSVQQVYRAAWSLLRGLGPDAAAGADEIRAAHNNNSANFETLEVSTVTHALTALVAFGYLRRKGKKYVLPTPTLFV